MQEALFYTKLPKGNVQCDACGHHCLIASGRRGLCRVRANIGGTLFSLNDGLCVAAAIDPIEKKPLYHYLPKSETYSFAAVGCNMHCPWCQNFDISQTPPEEYVIAGEKTTPEEHVQRAIQFKTPSISYTYSEPTVFVEYALATMKLAHEKNLKNIWVSNGYMSEQTLDAILPYLDAANIDVKGPNDAFYHQYCGGDLSTIMRNLKQMQEAGVHIELTTLVVPGLNDSEEQIRLLAEMIVKNLGVEVPWHITRFFPAWRMLDRNPTSLATLKTAKDIAMAAGIKHVHLGNV